MTQLSDNQPNTKCLSWNNYKHFFLWITILKITGTFYSKIIFDNHEKIVILQSFLGTVRKVIKFYGSIFLILLVTTTPNMITV